MNADQSAGTPPIPSIGRRLLPWGCGAAFAACLLNVLWLACIVFLQGQGDVATQAQSHPGVFRLSVGAALLLTILQVPILAAWALWAMERTPARAVLGGLFYALYIPVNLIAYYLYGRLGPLVHAPPGPRDELTRAVAAFIEIGHPLALFGTLPLLGYGLLGLAWCLLAPSLWRRGRPASAASILLTVAGALSLLGAAGGFLDVPWLTTCCFLGGVVSFPALCLLAIALWQEVRRDPAPASPLEAPPEAPRYPPPEAPPEAPPGPT